MHLTQDLSLTADDVARWMLRVEASGIGQGCGNQRSLTTGQSRCRRVEVIPGHGFSPVNAVARFHGVQIYFQNAVLAPENFDEHGEIDFQPFPIPGGTRPEEHVLGRLLADGAGTARPFAVLVLTDGFLDLLRIKPPMLEKPLVFGCNDGTFQIIRNVVARLPIVVPHQPVTAEKLFDRPYDHQRCHHNGYKTVNDYCQESGSKEKYNQFAKEAKDFSEHGCMVDVQI